MKVARPIRKLIESFERLPGIGPKTASRLAFYLLNVPQDYLESFADNLSTLKEKIVRCSICANIAESDPCPVCDDKNRDDKTLCVVEIPLDVLAIEKTGQFHGLYHVLNGAISPLNNIGPDELFIDQLLTRLKNNDFKELIVATNPNMEGEATAMYILNEIKKVKKQNGKLNGLRVTRIGLGLPTGADLEYADEMTLTRAIEGRREY